MIQRAQIYRFARYIASWLLVVVALWLFADRCNNSILRKAWDFAAIRSAADNWRQGLDPYDPLVRAAYWQRTALPAYVPQPVVRYQTIVASPVLPLMAVFTLVSLDTACAVALCTLAALLVLSVWVLWHLTGMHIGQCRAVLLLAFAIGLPTSQMAILAGQLTLPCLALAVLHLWAHRRGSHRVAGVLLGLSIALRPHWALAFLVLHIVQRRWQTVGWTVATTLLLTIIAIGRIEDGRLSWLYHWQAEVASSTTPGALNSYTTSAGRVRGGMLNLQVPLFALTRSPWLANAIAACSTLAMICLAWRWRPQLRWSIPSHDDDLILWAFVASLALLPVYHRTYDGVFLLPAVAWALTRLATHRRWLAPAVILLLSLGTLLRHLNDLQTDTAPAAPSFLYNTVWVPMDGWVVLLMTITLLLAYRSESREPTPDAVRLLQQPVPQRD